MRSVLLLLTIVATMPAAAQECLSDATNTGGWNLPPDAINTQQGGTDVIPLTRPALSLTSFDATRHVGTQCAKSHGVRQVIEKALGADGVAQEPKMRDRLQAVYPPMTHIVTAVRGGVPYSAQCRLADLLDPKEGRDLQIAEYHAFQLERNHRGGIPG